MIQKLESDQLTQLESSYSNNETPANSQEQRK